MILQQPTEEDILFSAGAATREFQRPRTPRTVTIANNPCDLNAPRLQLNRIADAGVYVVVELLYRSVRAFDVKSVPETETSMRSARQLWNSSISLLLKTISSIWKGVGYVGAMVVIGRGCKFQHRCDCIDPKLRKVGRRQKK